MKAQKRIWDVQSFTVCKVVGMALSLRELRKVARKFRFSHDPDVMNEEFSLHSMVVQFCRTDNEVARHTEKLIEERFGIHGKRLAGQDPTEVIRFVTEEPEALGVPLWAILWNVATRCSRDMSRLEGVVFGIIHMLEHRLVKEHWESLIAGRVAGESQADEAEELMLLKRCLLEAQQEKARLQRCNEELMQRLSAIQAQHEARRVQTPPAQDDHPVVCRCCAGRKVARFKVALEEARSRNRELELENAGLRRDIEALVAQASDRTVSALGVEVEPTGDEYPGNITLEGRCVAVVGGIDSLECHYRRLIESMGGCFWRHNGSCSGGDKPLLDCISRADLVVCPIEVNSHMAAKSVKRICKARGISCCFPRSASLSGLKRAVEEHYCGANVA